MAIIFWEQSAHLTLETSQQITSTLAAEGFSEIHVNASAKIVPDGYTHAQTDSVYAFAKTISEGPVIRLKENAEPIPPNLISKMLAKHTANESPYTYTDGKDLNRAIQIEIIKLDAFDLTENTLFYPDGSMGLFHLPGAQAYVFDSDDYAFYYEENFDRFYSYPAAISIEPSSRCNLKCKMCCYQSEMYSNAPMKDIPRFFSDTLHAKIIDGLATSNQPMSIEYCWRGEPTLAPNLFSMLRYTANKGTAPSLVTNATLLDEDKANELLDTGIGAITFSVDGASKETYESIRVGANYDTVTANIKRFIALAHARDKRPTICIKACVQKENRDEIDDILAQWIDLADFVIMQNQSFPGGEKYSRWFNPQALENLNSQRPPCHALWMSMAVSTTGNTAQCVTFFDEKKEDVLANAHETDILDIWNSPEFKNRRSKVLQQEFDEVPLCRECDGVSCSAITLGKRYTKDNIFSIFSAGYIMYSKADNKHLYPDFSPEKG